jgi:hypothetical protein
MVFGFAFLSDPSPFLMKNTFWNFGVEPYNLYCTERLFFLVDFMILPFIHNLLINAVEGVQAFIMSICFIMFNVNSVVVSSSTSYLGIPILNSRQGN